MHKGDKKTSQGHKDQGHSDQPGTERPARVVLSWKYVTLSAEFDCMHAILDVCQTTWVQRPVRQMPWEYGND